MMFDSPLLCAAAACIVLCAVAHGRPDVWVPDPMEKVLRNDAAPQAPSQSISMQAAGGEYESAQICVRSDGALPRVRIALSDLRGDGGLIGAGQLAWNVVGYVPLRRNSYAIPAGELCCTAPTDVPDPLLPGEPVDLEANQTQPFWLTVQVPRGTPAGEYSGTATVQWDGGEVPVALNLTVWPFSIPEEQHLTFTNWIDAGRLAKQYGVEAYSDGFWDFLARYAQAANEHYQNVLWLSLGVVGITQDAGGQFTFDWRAFDRWVEVVTENGCGRLIEISPIGSWANGWESTEIGLHSYAVSPANGEAKRMTAEEVLPSLLPALEAHLRERGWLERTVLHIADEPAVHHAASWREKSRWVHSLAPGIRRIDAIEAPDFGEDLEVWVPKLNHLYNWQDHYERAADAGAEMWFYTCCHPTGVFPNRFLDQPLIKTRILQWYNWRYDLSGYLHWGLNFWDADPFHSPGPDSLPPGDCWIIYPGAEGPLSSLRWEALRDGFEDYEYLWLLTDLRRLVAEKLGVPVSGFDPGARSDELARQLVPTMVDYTRDPAQIRSARETIAAEIIQLQQGPMAVVSTDPPLWHPLAEGPIVVATTVWAEEGAQVRVNGQAAHRQPNGSWAHHTGVSAETGEVKVEITLGEASKTVRRHYGVIRE